MSIVMFPIIHMCVCIIIDFVPFMQNISSNVVSISLKISCNCKVL